MSLSYMYIHKSKFCPKPNYQKYIFLKLDIVWRAYQVLCFYCDWPHYFNLNEIKNLSIYLLFLLISVSNDLLQSEFMDRNCSESVGSALLLRVMINSWLLSDWLTFQSCLTSDWWS